jgi:hypothetical protein
MPKLKARFVIQDLIVEIDCPTCGEPQVSPHYPDSLGWDKVDVRRAAANHGVVCARCRDNFQLPVKLVEMFAGL